MLNKINYIIKYLPAILVIFVSVVVLFMTDGIDTLPALDKVMIYLGVLTLFLLSLIMIRLTSVQITLEKMNRDEE